MEKLNKIEKRINGILARREYFRSAGVGEAAMARTAELQGAIDTLADFGYKVEPTGESSLAYFPDGTVVTFNPVRIVEEEARQC